MATKAMLINTGNFEYTKCILPTAKDSITKKIIKIAVIFLSLGTIFAATFILDLGNKIYVKITKKHHNAITAFPSLAKKEKIVKTANKFWEGFKEGVLQIRDGAKGVIHTINYNAHRQSPYNKYALSAGYIAATSLIFYLAAGYKGLKIATTLNLIGLSSIPFYNKQKHSSNIPKLKTT